MESNGEAMDDLFEDYENDDIEAGADNTEKGPTADETSGPVKIAPPKRIVRNPRLKFNPERLCGERGIPILADHFKNVKFKGSGHEKEDLDKLLSKLEHWTHRLFPSMKFQECLTHIEKLGKKRQVQTCVRKIRLNMSILSSDFVKDDEDNVRRNDDPEETEVVDPFDKLIGENHSTSLCNETTSETLSGLSTTNTPPMSDGRRLGSSFGSSMTEEQKERMERNRMLAAERRKARLSAVQQTTLDSPSTSHVLNASENPPAVQNSFDDLFNSLTRNQDTASSDSLMEISERDKSTQGSNSDNLGLDDLIDLVNDDSVSQNDSGKIESRNDCISNNADDANKSIKESAQELNGENSENLGLDDLIDLVDEKDTISATTSPVLSSEQAKSVSSCDGAISKNASSDSAIVINTDDLNEGENSENLELEDMIDLVNEKEPDMDNSQKSSEGDIEMLEHHSDLMPNNLSDNLLSLSKVLKTPEVVSKMQPNLVVFETSSDSNKKCDLDSPTKDILSSDIDKESESWNFDEELKAMDCEEEDP